jgi:ubiquinone/menaquinone biosynthesis C-methylase UbiE
MSSAVERFSGFADRYDRVRPRPPAELVEVVGQWTGTAAPSVVDLGAGTGLSAALWSGKAARIVAVEPSADMRRVALERIGALPDADAFTVVDAAAEDTGLPGGCADVVTASQALHWFDPETVFTEVTRILRPRGVFAAYDCDWPPFVDWECEAAYKAFERLVDELEEAQVQRPRYAAKEGHLERLRRSGLFRHVTEIALHSRDEGDADRLVGVALSQGGAVALLAAGVDEADIGLTRLREVAARRLATARPWWWTYRIRLAVV